MEVDALDKDSRKLQPGQKNSSVTTGDKKFSLDRFEQEVAEEMHAGLNQRRQSGLSKNTRSSTHSSVPTDVRNTDKS